MASQPYIQNWPFSAHERILLWWVRSPRQLTDEKQWCVSVCFEARDGRGHEFDLPWGALPLLRLGQYYANGFALNDDFIGRKTTLTLTGRPKLIPASDLLPPDFPYPGRHIVGQDLCLVFGGNPSVALPVTEAVRALLAHNRALAYGLFEPHFLEKIVSSTSVADGCLHIAFNKEISLKAIPKPIVGHLARLLGDGSFRESWDSVARERFSRTGVGGNSVPWPLVCRLPDLRCTWNARTLNLTGVELILEIIGVSPVKEMSFHKVSFSHPRMTATRKREGTRKKRRGRSEADSSGEQGSDTAVSTKPKGPRAPSESRELKSPPLPILDFKMNSIVRAPRMLDGRGDTVAGEGEPPVATKAAKSPLDAVSVADDAPPAQDRLPAGEFKPEQVPERGLELQPPPLPRSATDGLNLFAEMLDCLKQRGPASLEVGWCMGSFPIPSSEEPKTSRFALVGGLPRRYALVRLRWLQVTAWILECGQPDNRAPSTLVFCPRSEAKMGLLPLVDKLLREALTADGNWQEVKLAETRAANELSYELARHLSKLPEVWARRLYFKAAELVGATPRFISRP